MKEKVEQNVCSSIEAVFFLVKSRVLIDYHYYRLMRDLLTFEAIWCLNGVICEFVEEELYFPFYVTCSFFFSVVFI